MECRRSFFDGGGKRKSHTAAVIEEKIRRSLSRLEIDMSKPQMLKTRGNVEVGRPSKAWSPAEARRYGNLPKMSDVFGSEEDASSSEDESTYASDEDEDEEEEEEPAYL
ncbi:hypothetical protein Q1695_012452 [Nippostrongylus brasiliensis]|nr:hypothetical protein Q1695_012452 [Nippostrongylus brasiliensis]